MKATFGFPQEPKPLKAISIMDKFKTLISILTVLAMIGRAYIAYNRSHEQPIQSPAPAPIAINDDGSSNRDLVFRKDPQGHFRGVALINGVPMPFLIDTGATTTAIPLHLANQARLMIKDTGLVSTANGVTTVIKTEIESLRIGKAEIRNTEAGVLSNLDEVLLGMNVLQMFVMKTQGDTMTLTAGNFVKITEPGNESVANADDVETVSAATVQPYKPRDPDKKWKKNVTCDSHGENCKTAYSH